VTSKDLEQALRTINPHIRPNELAHVVQWAFEAKDGSQTPSMSPADVLQRLQNGVFYRQHSLSAYIFLFYNKKNKTLDFFFLS